MLIEQYLRTEKFTEAQNRLAEGLAAIEKTGERRGEAELYRLKGELVLRQNGAEAEAEGYFRQAIEIAQGQEALAWELRATVSLSRLMARARTAGRSAPPVGRCLQSLS